MRRFAQALGAEDQWTAKYFPELRADLLRGPDRYNVSGQGSALAILDRGDGPRVQECVWGIVPPWSKQSTTRYTTVTARLDRVSRSRMYKRAWDTQHCVIPITGYYKWDRSTKPARPYFIQAESGEPLIVAGLWECWDRDSTALYTFSILTHANPAIPPPLVPDGPIFLPPDKWRRWLKRGAWFPKAFLLGLPAPALEAYRVGPAIRDKNRDDYTLLEPDARDLPAYDAPEDDDLDPDD